MTFRFTLALTLGLALSAQSAPGDRQVIAVTDTYPDDPDLAKVINPLKAQILATFGQVIAHAPEGLWKANGGKEGGLGYWMADAMRLRAEAILGVPVKVGFTNTGGIRSNLKAGPVTVGNIYEIMPFENELVVADLTGEQVMDAVRQGVRSRGGEPVSGILVRTGGTPEHPELLITWSDGQPIDPKEVVKVATSDYLLASYDSFKKGRNPFTTGVTMRQVMLDACVAAEKQNQPLLPPKDSRYSISPELLQTLRAKH